MKTIKKCFQVQHTGNELELNEMNESKLSDFNVHTMNKKRTTNGIERCQPFLGIFAPFMDSSSLSLLNLTFLDFDESLTHVLCLNLNILLL